MTHRNIIKAILKDSNYHHDKELPDGIAEVFIDFAKTEKLSFWGRKHE